MMKELLAKAAPVLPVASFSSEEHIQALAELYNELGIPAVEVTLRHRNAWHHVALCRELMPNIKIGVGTVLNIQDMVRASKIADFAVSPGFSKPLCNWAYDAGFPYLPGVATATEIMTAIRTGYECLKFFPADIAGGTAALAALYRPFPNIAFCPTGGIGSGNYRQYLELENVLCVGGSFVTPSLPELLDNRSAVLEVLRKIYGKAGS